jgi:hypothetical protein
VQAFLNINRSFQANWGQKGEGSSSLNLPLTNALAYPYPSEDEFTRNKVLYNWPNWKHFVEFFVHDKKFDQKIPLRVRICSAILQCVL